MSQVKANDVAVQTQTKRLSNCKINKHQQKIKTHPTTLTLTPSKTKGVTIANILFVFCPKNKNN